MEKSDDNRSHTLALSVVVEVGVSVTRVFAVRSVHVTQTFLAVKFTLALKRHILRAAGLRHGQTSRCKSTLPSQIEPCVKRYHV